MSRARAALVAALVAAAAAPAGAQEQWHGAEPGRDASLWAEATETPDEELARRTYDDAMLAGDDHVAFATSERVMSTRRRMVEKAALAYETASRARPTAAEPHFRAAAVLLAFYIDCARDDAALCTRVFDRHAAERVIAHLDRFTAKAPLDPRTDEILFERAVLHTRLATPEHLRAAAVDYEEILRRSRGEARTDAITNPRLRLGLVLGNLAETYMMLGDLDQAIETYRASIRQDLDVSRTFGLAVALDRDEQRGEAIRVLRMQGEQALSALADDIASQRVFFVPEGEAEYYLALGAEVEGDPVRALEHYEAFVRSGAHPRFQPRAKAHIARLRKEIGRRPGGARPR